MRWLQTVLNAQHHLHTEAHCHGLLDIDYLHVYDPWFDAIMFQLLCSLA